MSISVSRESISKLMTELVDTFPMESDGRSSISDFGKLLFTEGQASTNTANNSNTNSNNNSNNNSAHSASDDNDDEEEEEDDEEEDEDEEQSAIEDAKIASATPLTANGAVVPGQKRVFTEIKGVPRQKQPDVQCVVTENGKIALSQSSMRKIMKSKDKAVPKRWTQEEDDRLREAVGRHGERNWKSIAEEVPGRNHTQCLQRWTKVLAPGLVKGHWRPDEDELLKELVAEGRKNWGQVATRIPGRTSKQCRERWYNHLDPSIVRGEYSAEEDRIILEAQSRLGNRWSAIAAMLPGRTEDAVKIRWKSLCRVRKGQGRRAQGDNKSKATTPKGMMNGGLPLHMMHHGGGTFGAAMGVKSEELGSFSSGMRMQQQVQMNARMQYANPAMGGQQNGMGYHVMNGGGMMYASSDMSAYDPNQYRKQQQQQMAAAYGLPPTAPSQIPGGSQDYNLDRRANAVNLHSQNGMPMAAQSGYRATGAYPGSYAMTTTTDGNIYNQAGGYSTASMTQMYHPQQQQQMQQMMASSYGYSVPPPTPSNGMGAAGSNLAGSFAQQLMQQQQPSYQQQETEQQQAPQEASSPQQQQQKESAAADHAAATSSPMAVKAEGPTGSAPAAPFNPAAMFAQSQAQKAASSNASPSSFNGGNSNPVAAFLQQQQKPANGASATRPPFNPAAAFAQRFSGQKPPMPGTSSAGRVVALDADDDEAGASGDKSVEPSLKKVKPRLSIDAARASAARRMRSSGSGAALAGRGSLDVFLNEIGDVGRLSDLKMDEFQTLDELWRVSDDMNRLSL